MRLDKIDLNLFVVFDAIYRERSITRVAGLLSLTQPAVSNALGRLRQTFDDPLFVRTSEGMMPTPVAESVINDVRRALDLLGDSVGANARFDPATAEGTFRLGMNDLLEALLLPPLQLKLAELAPNMSVGSYYLSRESATEELKAGRLDLLLDAPLVKSQDLYQQSLGDTAYVLAMRPGHPLSRKRKITIEHYLAAEHLHVSSRPRGRGHVELALHREGLQRHIAMRVQHYLVAVRVAAETDLLWTVPASLARTLPLVTKELPFQPDPLSWSLYWTRAADDDPANRWLREKVMEVVAVSEILVA